MGKSFCAHMQQDIGAIFIFFFTDNRKEKQMDGLFYV